MISLRNSLRALAIVIAASALSVASVYGQATATVCADGTTSSATGRGACSGHGGVSKTATAKQKRVVKNEIKAAKVAAKATPGTAAVVTCADNTTSTVTGRGACSHHGGVKAATTNSTTTGAVLPAPGTAAPPPSQRRTGSASAAKVGSGAKEDNNPVGAIAKCHDGLYSHARQHRGACSQHGGVATWL